MNKIPKEEVVKVMAELRAKGWSNEELAIKLGKTSQTIWRFSSILNRGTPCLSDYRELKALTVADKESVDKTK